MSSDASPDAPVAGAAQPRRVRTALARHRQLTGFTGALGWFTLDRLPLVLLAGLLVVSLVAADAYAGAGLAVGLGPFEPVWASYDRGSALILVGASLAGLWLAGALPMAHPVPPAWLAERAASTLGLAGWLWLGVACSGVLLGLAAKGPYLLRAPEYLAFAGPPPLVSLANLIAPVSLIAAGIVSVRRIWLGGTLAVVMTVILLAGATRLLAGALVLVIIGRLLGGVRVGPQTWGLAASSAALMLPIPLMLRAQDMHGLIPYSSATWQFMNSDGYLAKVAASVAENVGFTVPLLVHVADLGVISRDDMIIQLNPMPAGSAGWDGIVGQMRVHYYIPYSMLGEFAHFGPLILLSALFAWGALQRLSIQLVADPDSRLALFFLTGQLGVGLISVLYVCQYNTRAATRALSMMLITALAFHVMRAVLDPGPRAGRHALPR